MSIPASCTTGLNVAASNEGELSAAAQLTCPGSCIAVESSSTCFTRVAKPRSRFSAHLGTIDWSSTSDPRCQAIPTMFVSQEMRRWDRYETSKMMATTTRTRSPSSINPQRSTGGCIGTAGGSMLAD